MSGDYTKNTQGLRCYASTNICIKNKNKNKFISEHKKK